VAPLAGPVSVDASEATAGGSRQEDLMGQESEIQLSQVDAQDDEYFEAYAEDLYIHEQMLNDELRTSSYQRAIEGLGERIQGAVVLDVGCGTGVLSVFAARAGARRVYAVEASGMAQVAEEVMEKNGVADTVTVVNCRVEDLVLPEEVDVIVSEWMGTALVFESMWEGVLLARDRWLRMGGLILPSRAQLWAAPVELHSLWTAKVDMWKQVWGIDMSSIVPRAKERFFRRPIIDHTIDSEAVLASGELLLDLDMSVATKEDIEDCCRTWVARPTRSGMLHGAVLWFVCSFPTRVEERLEHVEKRLEKVVQALEKAGTGRGSDLEATQGESKGIRAARDKGITLSTSPMAPLTHWGHNLLVFDTPHPISPDQVLGWRFRMNRNPEFPRHYHLHLEASPMDPEGGRAEDLSKPFTGSLAPPLTPSSIPPPPPPPPPRVQNQQGDFAVNERRLGPWYESKLFPLWR